MESDSSTSVMSVACDDCCKFLLLLFVMFLRGCHSWRCSGEHSSLRRFKQEECQSSCWLNTCESETQTGARTRKACEGETSGGTFLILQLYLKSVSATVACGSPVFVMWAVVIWLTFIWMRRRKKPLKSSRRKNMTLGWWGVTTGEEIEMNKCTCWFSCHIIQTKWNLYLA